MIEIYIGKGQGGHVRIRYAHRIYVKEPDVKSYTAYVLLRNELLLQDIDYIENETKKRIEFSRIYLRERKEKEGNLTCKYCSRTDLIIEEEGMLVPNRKKATIDHVVPISKGGPIYDFKNIVVACGRCNGKKGNKDLEVFLLTR